MGMELLKKYKKMLAVAVSCLCIAAFTVTGVWAYLTSNPDPLVNEFTPAKVSCAVDETFQDGIKSDVRIRNTGNVEAYVRAIVVATFVSDDGKVYATAPKEGVDYIVDWGTMGWVKGSNGYWYSKKPIAPNEQTYPLIETATSVKSPNGYKLSIQIAASAIQSTPEKAVTEAWNVNFAGGELMPN